NARTKPISRKSKKSSISPIVAAPAISHWFFVNLSCCSSSCSIRSLPCVIGWHGGRAKLLLLHADRSAGQCGAASDPLLPVRRMLLVPLQRRLTPLSDIPGPPAPSVNTLHHVKLMCLE